MVPSPVDFCRGDADMAVSTPGSSPEVSTQVLREDVIDGIHLQ